MNTKIVEYNITSLPLDDFEFDLPTLENNEVEFTHAYETVDDGYIEDVIVTITSDESIEDKIIEIAEEDFIREYNDRKMDEDESLEDVSVEEYISRRFHDWKDIGHNSFKYLGRYHNQLDSEYDNYLIGFVESVIGRPLKFKKYS
jgi:hypothetical protein